ncbi:MAG: hypothetical protein AAF682_16890 [Planctomycetota bacterium]
MLRASALRILSALCLALFAGSARAQCPSTTLHSVQGTEDDFGHDLALAGSLAVIGNPEQHKIHIAQWDHTTGLYSLVNTISTSTVDRYGAQVALFNPLDGVAEGIDPCSAEVYASAPDAPNNGFLYISVGSPECSWQVSARAGTSLGTATDPITSSAKVGEAMDGWERRLIVGVPDNVNGRGSAYLLENFNASPVSFVDIAVAAGVFPAYTGNPRVGAAVAVNNRWALVGAPRDPGDVGGWVWVFERVGGTWTYHSGIYPPLFSNEKNFGLAIELDGNSALISTLTASGYETRMYSYGGGASWTQGTFSAPGIASALDDDRALVNELPHSATFVCSQYPARPYYRDSLGNWTAGPVLRYLPFHSFNDLLAYPAAIQGETALVGSLSDACGPFPEGRVYQENLACFAGSSADCNGNGLPDSIDIHAGTSADCNGNGIPDECEADCDGDGTPDDCEPDCDGNGTPDDCDLFLDCNNNGTYDCYDIAQGVSADCNGNGIPDECEPDCDGDGTPDDCEPFVDCNNNGTLDCLDIAGGTSLDCNANGVPDECEPDCDGDGTPDDCEPFDDCNNNGTLDCLDIAGGTSLDCNANGVPDECEPDCDDDGIPDDCEAFVDCNGNGVDDCLDIASGFSSDCNGNGVPDLCDLTAGTSPDCDGNGILDECDIAAGNPPDCDPVVISNGVVDLTIVPDPVFGAVYDHLLNLSVTGPAGPGDGMFFAPTDLWKVSLRNTAFSGSPVPTEKACDLQPADGVVHIRASDVTAMPVFTLFPDELAPTELRCRWTIPATAVQPIDDLDYGTFPLEDFEVEVVYATQGTDDFVSINMNVRMTGDDPRLSVYRLELRTAAELAGAPEKQILAAPWYFGVLLPDPVNAQTLGFADCLADIRLSDPEHGKSIATHPGVMTMQWMAFYQDDPEQDLLYWGTHDTGNHLKPYLVYPEEQGLGFGVQYQPVDNLNVTGNPTAVSMPFDVVMTSLKGDWYDAAQYYRDWAVDPDWTWIPDELPGAAGSGYSELMYEAQALGTVSIAPCSLTLPPKDFGWAKEYANFDHWKDEWDDFESFFGLDPDTGLVGRPWFWDRNAFDASFGEWLPVQQDFLAAAAEITKPWGPYFHPLVVDKDAAFFASPGIPGIAGSLDQYTVRDEFGREHAASIYSVPKDQGCGLLPKTTWHHRILCPAAVPNGAPVFDTVPLLYTKHILQQLDAAMAPGGGELSGVYLDEYHHIERVCYADHGHAPGGDGSYFVDGKQVLGLLVKDWMRTQLGVAEPWVWTEGASEPYVGSVEVCNLSYGGVFGGEDPAFLRVPMFQTVYNEYQRFASVLPANLPLGDATLNWVDWAERRAALAQYSHDSGEVALGTVLSDASIQDNIAQHPPYDLAVNLVRNTTQALKTDEARDLMRFGQRFRDPALQFSWTPAPPSPTPPPQYLDPPPLGVPPGGSFSKASKDTSFPPVLASVCGESGERVGLLLINWTAVDDFFVAPFLVDGSEPGNQLVTVTLDPQSYGFPSSASAPTLRNVLTGEMQTLAWDGSSTIDVTLQVDEISAGFYVLEAE